MQVMPDALDEDRLFSTADTHAITDCKSSLLQSLLDAPGPAFAAARVAAAAAAQPCQLPAPDAPCGVSWLVLDASLRGAAADRLAALLLAKPVALNSGARVRVQDHQRLLWECEDLAGASPTLLTSAGICIVHEPLQDAERLLAGVMDAVLGSSLALDKVSTMHSLRVWQISCAHAVAGIRLIRPDSMSEGVKS